MYKELYGDHVYGYKIVYHSPFLLYAFIGKIQWKQASMDGASQSKTTQQNKKWITILNVENIFAYSNWTT